MVIVSVVVVAVLLAQPGLQGAAEGAAALLY
jgi:hypothetical protein